MVVDKVDHTIEVVMIGDCEVIEFVVVCVGYEFVNCHTQKRGDVCNMERVHGLETCGLECIE